MKRGVIVISLLLLFLLSSCDTPSNRRNPQLNNSSFTNYTPWWVYINIDLRGTNYYLDSTNYHISTNNLYYNICSNNLIECNDKTNSN